MKTRGFDMERLRKKLPLLIVAFMIAQPLLDVLGYWQAELGISNALTLSMRMLLLTGMLALGFLLSERKRIYYLSAAVFLCYLAGHILSCAAAGYLDPLEDLSEQIRIFMLPATALCFSSFLRRDSRAFPTLQLCMVINLGIILAVELLSVLTGTDPHTYSNKQIGVLGWFLWANSQSAILSILCPLCLAWALRKYQGRILPLTIAAMVSFGLLFFCATRLAYVSLMATGLCFALGLLLLGREFRRRAAVLLLLTLLFAGLLPVSPMVKNRRKQAENATRKQALVSMAAEARGVDASALRTENPEALKAAYSYMLQGLVDRFGLERVAKAYDYSLDVNRIWDRRLMLLTGCRLQMEDSPGVARWFGLELGQLRQSTRLYDFDQDSWEDGIQSLDPENDYLGVYFLCGGVGLALILGMLLLVSGRAIYALLREPKKILTPEFLAYAIACCIGTVYAYATVSVLRRNNASVYFGLVLAGLWYLSPIGGSNDQQIKETIHADQHRRTNL